MRTYKVGDRIHANDCDLSFAIVDVLDNGACKLDWDGGLKGRLSKKDMDDYFKRGIFEHISVIDVSLDEGLFEI